MSNVIYVDFRKAQNENVKPVSSGAPMVFDDAKAQKYLREFRAANDSTFPPLFVAAVEEYYGLRQRPAPAATVWHWLFKAA